MPDRLPLWAGRTAALLGILLVALSLRNAVDAISPIIGQVSRDIPLGTLLLGVIGAAPPVTFAVTGLATPAISRRLGLEGALLLAAGLMAIGQLGRALAPDAVLLVVGTIVTLVGAAIGNVLLPPVVKRYFGDRITQVTTAYAVLISVSTALPALTVVPIASAAGWRIAIGCWFLIATSAALPWIVATIARRRVAGGSADDPGGADLEPEPKLERRVFHSPLAWAIMVTFSLSSINVYAFFAWLPKLLVDTAGVSSGTAGALLALYAIMGFPASLLVPYLASRMRNVGVLLYVAVALILVGDGGLALAPAAAPVLWVVLAGLGPLLFPLSLVLINARTRTHEGSVALSGFVQGIGYIIAAVSPLAFGLLEQATGSWTWSLCLVMAVTLAAIPAAFVLSRGHYLEDELGS